MKWIKLFLKCAAFVLLFQLCSRFCEQQTDGFAISKIHSYLPFDPRWNLPQDPPYTLLDQKFYYLSKGAQCYVFVSADHQYVLKFFRQKLFHFPDLYSLRPLPSFLEEKQQKAWMKKKAAIEKDFQSYCIAYKELKNETGLIFLHLNKSDTFKKPLVIVDKLGIEHSIDPNKHEFFLQKKVSLIPEKIEEEMKKHHIAGAKEVIRSLFTLIESRIEKKIMDADANLKKNFGFSEGRAIQIDIGRFSTAGFSKKRALSSLNKRKEDLQFWINEHYPELSDFFNAEYQRTFEKP